MEGGGSNSQLKDSGSSFPVREGSGWAGSRALGRCWFGSPSALPPPVSSQAVAVCPASQLAKRYSPGTEVAGAAACISGDEAWLPPGFYLFRLVKKLRLNKNAKKCEGSAWPKFSKAIFKGKEGFQ